MSNSEPKNPSSQDASTKYQQNMERIVASLIRKYDWLDGKCDMYAEDIDKYIKIIDALTKVSAHIRDFLKMAGVKIGTDADLALWLAKLKEDLNEKKG